MNKTHIKRAHHSGEKRAPVVYTFLPEIQSHAGTRAITRMDAHEQVQAYAHAQSHMPYDIFFSMQCVASFGE